LDKTYEFARNETESFNYDMQIDYNGNGSYDFEGENRHTWTKINVKQHIFSMSINGPIKQGQNKNDKYYFMIIGVLIINMATTEMNIKMPPDCVFALGFSHHAYHPELWNNNRQAYFANEQWRRLQFIVQRKEMYIERKISKMKKKSDFI